MENQEKLKEFIIQHLGERLIDFKRYTPRENADYGRMYFPQTIVEKSGEKYYKTFNGLRKISDVLELMQTFKTKEVMDSIKMNPVGRYLGSTKCRCCGNSLGNGSGHAIFSDNGEKEYFSLTGGADHYISHDINLNLVSYLFKDKEKKIKAHIIFIGELNDIQQIKQYISTLDNELVLNETKKLKMR